MWLEHLPKEMARWRPHEDAWSTSIGLFPCKGAVALLWAPIECNIGICYNAHRRFPKLGVMSRKDNKTLLKEQTGPSLDCWPCVTYGNAIDGITEWIILGEVTPSLQLSNDLSSKVENIAWSLGILTANEVCSYLWWISYRLIDT